MVDKGHFPNSKAPRAAVLLFVLILLACSSQDEFTSRLISEGNCRYQIAFGSEDEEGISIHLFDLSEPKSVNLTSDLDSAAYPAWSPDAKRLLFTSPVRSSDETSSGTEIFTIGADGSARVRLTDHFGDYLCPSWSPDGLLILFSTPNYGYSQIGTMEVDDPREEVLLTSLRSKNLTPAWSPSGELIAFSSDRSGDLDIYVMDKHGGNSTRLTYNQGDDAWPAWSRMVSRLLSFQGAMGMKRST